MARASKQIVWTFSEWEIICNNLQKYVDLHGKFPPPTDKDTWCGLWMSFPEDRHKVFYATMPYFLQNKYKEWKDKKVEVKKIVKAAATSWRNAKPVKIDVPPVMETLPTAIIEEISEEFPQVLSVQNDIMVQIEILLNEKLKPIHDFISTFKQLYTAQSKPEVSDATTAPVIAEEDAPSRPRTPKEAVVEQKSLIKIFVVGLQTTQLSSLRVRFKRMKNLISIEGADAFNDSVIARSKNSDHVVVSKFSSHSIFNTLRNECGANKVTFISGGISMISAHLREYIDTLQKI